MPKNWFGLEYHPTDDFIDWREKDPVSKATVLRAAYDKIKAFGLKEELDILTSAAYDQGREDTLDNYQDSI